MLKCCVFLFPVQYSMYNTILRQWPKDLYTKFAESGNTFITTINVLVSAIHKLSRHTYIEDGQRLYRGMGGNFDLPDHFHTEDGNGCRGITEWGFMSTTSDRSVAVQYSGVRQGRPHAMVMEIVTSSVDRGAYIGDYSQ